MSIYRTDSPAQPTQSSRQTGRQASSHVTCSSLVLCGYWIPGCATGPLPLLRWRYVHHKNTGLEVFSKPDVGEGRTLKTCSFLPKRCGYSLTALQDFCCRQLGIPSGYGTLFVLSVPRCVYLSGYSAESAGVIGHAM